MTKIHFVLAALGCLAVSHPALACETPVNLTITQVRDALAALSDDTKDEFSRYLAYQELSCSDDPVVVGFAREAGLKSQISPLVTAIFHDRLYALEVLLLRPDPTVEMSQEQRAWAAQNPVIRLNFYKGHRDQSCISLTSYNDCRADAVVSVDGNNLSISTRQSGELQLAEDGGLVGMWYPGDGLRIPIIGQF